MTSVFIGVYNESDPTTGLSGNSRMIIGDSAYTVWRWIAYGDDSRTLDELLILQGLDPKKQEAFVAYWEKQCSSTGV